MLKINVYEKVCMIIVWYLDGIYFISGGVDLKLYVWDLGLIVDKR